MRTFAQRRAAAQAPAPKAQPIARSTRKLGAEVRARYEPVLGVSLEDVRIHTDARAAVSAAALDADAYTVGRDIVFGAGRYSPGSPAGEHLLAHELAHVVQQRGGASPTAALEVSRPGDGAEREADRAAEAAVAGRATGLTPGSAPVAVHRQRRGPMRANRFLPDEKAQLRKLGRGELDELIEQIIADGRFHAALQETIEGVTHIWEIKTELFELSEREQLEGAQFGGAVGAERVVVEAGGTTVRHRLTYILRGGRASTLEAALHELIHLRIMIDRALPQAKRSSFYREYAQAAELTEVMPGVKFGAVGAFGQKASYGALPIIAGTWEKLRIVLQKIEAIRKFLLSLDGNAVAAFDKDPELTPAALVEFVTQEKYVTQTAAKAVSRRAPGNETVAARYARAVEARFERHLSAQVRSRLNASPVGSKQRSDLLDELRLAIQRLYDAIDQALAGGKEFLEKPNTAPSGLPDPRLFESRPLGIGGEPVPFR